jgi:hypothetical protein
MTMYQWQAKQAQGRANIRWIKAYLECLFDGRDVFVLAHEQRQLDLFLQ